MPGSAALHKGISVPVLHTGVPVRWIVVKSQGAAVDIGTLWEALTHAEVSFDPNTACYRSPASSMSCTNETRPQHTDSWLCQGQPSFSWLSTVMKAHISVQGIVC